MNLDTNVGGGLWSLTEAQLGFIAANLPHLRPLAIGLRHGVRSHAGASSRSGSHAPSNSPVRSWPASHRSRPATFSTLAFTPNDGAVEGTALRKDEELAGSNVEVASIDTNGSEHELVTAVAPQGWRGGPNIAVKTEIT